MVADRQFLPPSKTFIRLGHSQRLIVCAHGLVPDQGTVDSVGATWFMANTSILVCKFELLRKKSKESVLQHNEDNFTMMNAEKGDFCHKMVNGISLGH